MMKTRILLPLLFIVLKSNAQTIINKTITVKPEQTIDLHFDYPKLIRISTWDKNEISIQGTVSINSGENDDAFVLQSSTEGNLVSIMNEIKDIKKLPHRITIKDGEKTISFKDKSEFEKYKAEQGRGFDRISTGLDMEITLEIKVPAKMITKITAIYGMVEVKEFNGPITVEATYGGVDASLSQQVVGDIAAETNYGEILTNLDVKFAPNGAQGDFHTLVSAHLGNGSKCFFGSKYGKVYLRKSL